MSIFMCFFGTQDLSNGKRRKYDLTTPTGVHSGPGSFRCILCDQVSITNIQSRKVLIIFDEGPAKKQCPQNANEVIWTSNFAGNNIKLNTTESVSSCLKFIRESRL